MSQRYTFEDDSGDVRLSGTLTPSPAAGGTFTGPVVIDNTDANAISLKVIGGGTTEDFATTLDIRDSANVQLLYSDTSGEVDVRLREDSAGFNVVVGSTAVLKVERDTSTTHVVRVAATRLGFYGVVPIVQPSLTSGTATPEQITLALQALGLAGGS